MLQATHLVQSLKLHGKSTENARNEQDADQLLKALKPRLLHNEYDKHLLKISQSRRRNLLRKEELSRMESLCELLRRSHAPSIFETETYSAKTALNTTGKMNKHQGNTKMIQEC